MEKYTLIENIAADQDGIVTARQCIEVGFSRNQIATLCRRKNLRRLFWGTYLVNADLVGEPSSRARIRSALLSAGGVAIRDTAAELLGIAGAFPGDRPVHVACPVGSGRRQRVVDRDLRYHEVALRPSEITVVDGVRVSSVVRTLADLLLSLDRLSGVAAVDSALQRGLIQPQGLAAVGDALAGRRLGEMAADRLTEVNAKAESPLETRARLRCVDGRVPPDELQAEILDASGDFLARVDMLWRAGRVVGEADGAEFHDRPDALYHDRERQNALVSAGFKVIRFTWQDTVRPGDIPEMVRTALAQRR